MRLLRSLASVGVVVVGLLAGVPASTAAPTASPGKAPERYCGLAAQTDVYVTKGAVSCVVALRTIVAMNHRPPSGNGPGSPPGWTCYRVSGGLYGDACDQVGGGRSTIEVLGADDGTRDDGTPRTGKCAKADSYVPQGQFTIKNVAALNCSYVVQVLIDWVWNNGGRGVGPVKFACKKQPGSIVGGVITCVRGRARFVFAETS